VTDEVVLSDTLRERLLATIAARHPTKSFGYLLTDLDAARPTDFVLFEQNVRNDAGWKPRFEGYGRYFVEHDDAGFVAAPEESWRLQKEIWRREMFEVAVFHSHQRHPANFSRIDYDTHLSRFSALWHLIVSMRNPRLPQIRAFSVSAAGVRELRIRGGVPGYD
jgi:proteasome lid subunit RPN8/RPN11